MKTPDYIAVELTVQAILAAYRDGRFTDALSKVELLKALVAFHAAARSTQTILKYSKNRGKLYISSDSPDRRSGVDDEAGDESGETL